MGAFVKGEDGYFVMGLGNRGLVLVGRTYKRATGQAPACTTPSALYGQAPTASNEQAQAAWLEGRRSLHGMGMHARITGMHVRPASRQSLYGQAPALYTNMYAWPSSHRSP